MQKAGSADRIFVRSSELRWIEYNASRALLTVEFVAKGEIYQYERVPKSKFEALLAAPSKGRYFNAHIRDYHSFVHLS